MTAECPSCLSHFPRMSANLLVFILQNRVLLPSRASLKLTIFLPQAVRCRDSGCTPLLLHSSRCAQRSSSTPPGVPTAPPPLLRVCPPLLAVCLQIAVLLPHHFHLPSSSLRFHLGDVLCTLGFPSSSPQPHKAVVPEDTALTVPDSSRKGS